MAYVEKESVLKVIVFVLESYESAGIVSKSSPLWMLWMITISSEGSTVLSNREVARLIETIASSSRVFTSFFHASVESVVPL